MCLGALPLAMKAFGGNTRDMAMTAISPALGFMSALSHKKKKPVSADAAPMVTQGVVGPSPSYGG
jgi:hypothetical protein